MRDGGPVGAAPARPGTGAKGQIMFRKIHMIWTCGVSASGPRCAVRGDSGALFPEALEPPDLGGRQREVQPGLEGRQVGIEARLEGEPSEAVGPEHLDGPKRPGAPGLAAVPMANPR